jgi:hypothetical protein
MRQERISGQRSTKSVLRGQRGTRRAGLIEQIGQDRPLVQDQARRRKARAKLVKRSRRANRG